MKKSRRPAAAGPSEPVAAPSQGPKKRKANPKAAGARRAPKGGVPKKQKHVDTVVGIPQLLEFMTEEGDPLPDMDDARKALGLLVQSILDAGRTAVLREVVLANARNGRTSGRASGRSGTRCGERCLQRTTL